MGNREWLSVGRPLLCLLFQIAFGNLIFSNFLLDIFHLTCFSSRCTHGAGDAVFVMTASYVGMIVCLGCSTSVMTPC